MTIRAHASRRTISELSRRFGNRVRTFRKRKGWSLEDLADKAAMHVTYLSSIERGHRNPTLNVVDGIASALGVTLATLLNGISTKE